MGRYHAGLANAGREASSSRHEAREAAAHNFFVGVLVDASVRDPLHELGYRTRQQHRLRGALRPKELLHVTLCPLGRYGGPDENLDRMLDITRLLCGKVSVPSFRVRFDRVATFNGGRDGRYPVVAIGGEGVVGLEMLQSAVARAIAPTLELLKLNPHEAFTPHVTLLYADRTVPEHRVAPIEWTVREFSLIHSNVGQSRYDILGTWPLRPAH